MSLFNRNKFKKVDSQNVSVQPEIKELPKLPEEPKAKPIPPMPSPSMIANISKAVIENMAEQPTDLSIMNKELDQKIAKKIAEVEMEIKVKQEVLKILRGI